jgi:cytochrome c556
MQRRFIWISAGLIAASLAGAVAAADMASVIKERQAHYKEIGKAAKGIHDQLTSGSPNVAQLQAYAKTLDTLAPQIPSWFPQGSGPEAGVKTGALPAIWAKPAEFKTAAANLATQAHTLNTVAAGGDVAAIGAQFGAVGKACKDCHDQFRHKD